MKIAGIILLVLGALGLIYGGFKYTSRDKVIDLGPLQVSADREHTVPIAPIAGAALLVAGTAMVLTSRRQG